MKKIFAGVIIVVVLLLAAIYIFIPAKWNIAAGVVYQANKEAVYRFLIRDSNWQQWWPGHVLQDKEKENSFQYDDYSLQMEKPLYNAIELKIEGDNHTGKGLLRILPYNADSMQIELTTEWKTGADPFSRVSGYFRAQKIKSMLHTIIGSLQAYTSDVTNMYGIGIRKEKVQYQYVLSAKKSFSRYPSTEDIYLIVGKLRTHISKSGAKELFHPMLNVSKTDSVNYIVQVGLPVDKEIPGEDNMTSKWMMKGGNILAGEVTGGPQQIEEALKKFEQYILDHQRTIIAIPFQMLITDRTKEPDSTKWITRWYYPVV